MAPEVNPVDNQNKKNSPGSVRHVINTSTQPATSIVWPAGLSTTAALQALASLPSNHLQGLCQSTLLPVRMPSMLPTGVYQPTVAPPVFGRGMQQGTQSIPTATVVRPGQEEQGYQPRSVMMQQRMGVPRFTRGN